MTYSLISYTTPSLSIFLFGSGRKRTGTGHCFLPLPLPLLPHLPLPSPPHHHTLTSLHTYFTLTSYSHIQGEAYLSLFFLSPIEKREEMKKKGAYYLFGTFFSLFSSLPLLSSLFPTPPPRRWRGCLFSSPSLEHETWNFSYYLYLYTKFPPPTRLEDLEEPIPFPSSLYLTCI